MQYFYFFLFRVRTYVSKLVSKLFILLSMHTFINEKNMRGMTGSLDCEILLLRVVPKTRIKTGSKLFASMYTVICSQTLFSRTLDSTTRQLTGV